MSNFSSIPSFGPSANSAFPSIKSYQPSPQQYRPMPIVNTPSFGNSYSGAQTSSPPHGRHSSYTKVSDADMPSMQPSVERVRRSREYYLEGGDLIFLVENCLFRVHRYFFERESPVFRKQLADAVHTGHPRIGMSDTDPCVLHDVNADDFSRFLWVFYNPLYSIYEASIEDWAAILGLAHHWQFSEVKALVVRELEKHIIPSITKIVIYHRYGVARNLLLPSYVDLCVREQALDLEEAKDLGLETSMMIMTAREIVRKGDGSTSAAVTMTIEELKCVICQVFRFPEPRSDTPMSNSSEDTVAEHSPHVNMAGYPEPSDTFEKPSDLPHIKTEITTQATEQPSKKTSATSASATNAIAETKKPDTKKPEPNKAEPNKADTSTADTSNTATPAVVPATETTTNKQPEEPKLPEKLSLPPPPSADEDPKSSPTEKDTVDRPITGQGDETPATPTTGQWVGTRILDQVGRRKTKIKETLKPVTKAQPTVDQTAEQKHTSQISWVRRVEVKTDVEVDGSIAGELEMEKRSEVVNIKASGPGDCIKIDTHPRQQQKPIQEFDDRKPNTDNAQIDQLNPLLDDKIRKVHNKTVVGVPWQIPGVGRSMAESPVFHVREGNPETKVGTITVGNETTIAFPETDTPVDVPAAAPTVLVDVARFTDGNITPTKAKASPADLTLSRDDDYGGESLLIRRLRLAQERSSQSFPSQDLTVDVSATSGEITPLAPTVVQKNGPEGVSQEVNSTRSSFNWGDVLSSDDDDLFLDCDSVASASVFGGSPAPPVSRPLPFQSQASSFSHS